MTARRVPDWPAILVEHIEAARQRPFSWGEHDCGHWCADWVLAVRGFDPMERWRGGYDSPASLARLLKRLADGTVEGAWTQEMGQAPLSTVLRARRGDIVSVDTDEGPALGIVAGAEAAFVGPDGLGFLPMSSWRLGWEV